MKATLIIEHRFRQDLEGKIYSSSNSINTLLWDRYLQDFESLTVLARIQRVDYHISESYLVSYDRVSFKSIPYYVGPKQFLMKYFEIKCFINSNIEKNHAYICRLPSILGNIAIKSLKENNIPYVVELVGDPWEVFAPGALKNPLSFFHRYRSYLTLKRNVKNANGVIYVTENMLQKRYPSSPKAITTHASNVILRKKSINTTAKRLGIMPEPLKLISIGSLEQLYKAPDIILKAMRELVTRGIKVELTWLGDGIYKSSMIQMTKELGLSDFVNFKGNVSSEDVSRDLDNSHLYVHVSRTEGLPRAVIEAMAKGLPCIGSRVGGIPELLAEECLIDKNSVTELVEKIIYFRDNLDFLNDQGAKNLLKAWEFEFETLAARRSIVYKSLLN